MNPQTKPIAMPKKKTAKKPLVKRKPKPVALKKTKPQARHHAAFQLLNAKNQPVLRQVIASSFADPADVAAFKKCNAQGGSDQHCFQFGDNGIGFMGDDCTGPTPMCALPVEDWKERWSNKTNARLKPVIVTANGKTVVCLLGDTMPKRANITNGAGLDLSPAAAKAIGRSPPFKIPAVWSWQDDEE